MTDIVDTVQIRVPILVKHVLSSGTYNLQGILLKEQLTRFAEILKTDMLTSQGDTHLDINYVETHHIIL